MARGWESKGVEAQLQEQEERRQRKPVRAEPGSVANAEAQQRQRELEGFRLSRIQVMAQLQRVDSPSRRRALESALAFLDARIQAAQNPAIASEQ